MLIAWNKARSGPLRIIGAFWHSAGFFGTLALSLHCFRIVPTVREKGFKLRHYRNLRRIDIRARANRDWQARGIRTAVGFTSIEVSPSASAQARTELAHGITHRDDPLYRA